MPFEKDLWTSVREKTESSSLNGQHRPNCSRIDAQHSTTVIHSFLIERPACASQVHRHPINACARFTPNRAAHDARVHAQLRVISGVSVTLPEALWTIGGFPVQTIYLYVPLHGKPPMTQQRGCNLHPQPGRG